MYRTLLVWLSGTPYIIGHQLTLVIERKTKTGKTPCAWCKMALTSHWYCDWLRIPRASSGIFSQSQHHPIGFCIKRKAINKKNNCSAGNITEYSVRRMENSIPFAAVSLVQSWKERLYLLQEMFFMFIALKRMVLKLGVRSLFSIWNEELPFNED